MNWNIFFFSFAFAVGLTVGRGITIRVVVSDLRRKGYTEWDYKWRIEGKVYKKETTSRWELTQ